MILLPSAQRGAIDPSGAATDPYWSSVVVSLPLTADKEDLKGHTATLVGNASVSGGYLNLDGNGDSLDLSASADYAMGAGDFTYEFFVTYTSAPSNAYTFDHAGGNTTRLQIGSAISGWRLFGEVSEIQSGGTPFSPSTGTEYYLAVRRSGTSVTSAQGTTGATTAQSAGTSAQNFGQNATLHLGNYGGGGAFGINGKIRHVRITKGVARDISTVPTVPFPTS